jgi:hypothetical protein
MDAHATRRSVLDPCIVVRVVRRTPLVYAAGEDAAEDCPRHVRAASGLAVLDGHLAIVQDDALFVALFSPSGVATALPLPRGHGGARLFDDARGNKHHKLDLEACVVAPVDGAPTLIAFGSGSSPARERIVLVGRSGVADVVDARAFYAALRACADFAGSELNVEGAVVSGDSLVLASRGNGAPRGDLTPIDATCRVELAAFVEFVASLRPGASRDRARGRVPDVSAALRFDLGEAGGARLTFTDLAREPATDRLLYVACAEASADAVSDGPVSGVALGELGERPRYGLVRDERGELLTDNIEGILSLGDGRFHAVIDVDDPDRPAELLELQAEGL